MDGIVKLWKMWNSVFHNDGMILLSDEIGEIYNCNEIRFFEIV